MRAYITVRDRAGKRLGRAGLERLTRVEAPGLSRDRYAVRPYSHHGLQVLLVEERFAASFRERFEKVRGAVTACGYRMSSELTADARRAIGESWRDRALKGA